METIPQIHDSVFQHVREKLRKPEEKAGQVRDSCAMSAGEQVLEPPFLPQSSVAI